MSSSPASLESMMPQKPSGTNTTAPIPLKYVPRRRRATGAVSAAHGTSPRVTEARGPQVHAVCAIDGTKDAGGMGSTAATLTAGAAGAIGVIRR
jgi:hypothetical protein